MSCRQVAVSIDTFLDGELPPEQTIDVEQHLAGCDACMERVRFENALRTSLRRAVTGDGLMSPGFEARLSGALRAERERILEAVPSAPKQNRFRRAAVLPLLLAAATTFSFVAWLNGRLHDGARQHSEMAMSDVPRLQIATETPEQVLDELVSYHAAPPEPQITEPTLVPGLEPEVGVPVRLPALKQYGASWVGGGVVPMKNQHAALFRYRLENHPVTVYVYNAGRVPLRGVLEPRVVHNQPVHVGERRGYSIAAVERHGVGYAVATDLNNDESAELVSTIY
jgi:anti-sigma factor RsiW